MFMFSDDLTWCRDNFGQMGQVTVVGHEHAGPRFSHYLWLMTLCRQFVIPNSTFAWWAAWLASNESKIVVCPNHWFADPDINTSDLIPLEWIRI